MVEKERIGSDWVILDEWSVLIKGAKGRGEEILKETEKAIKESEVEDEIKKANFCLERKSSEILIHGNKDLERGQILTFRKKRENNKKGGRLK